MLRINKSLALFILFLISTFSSVVNAKSAEHYVVVAPTCLSKHLSAKHHVLASTPTFSLMTMGKKGIHQLMLEKSHSGKLCGGFMDVTQPWNDYQKQTTLKKDNQEFLNQFTQPVHIQSMVEYNIQYPKQVNQLLAQLNPQNMWNNLTTLSNFDDRYAKSDNGVKAANWFKEQIETIAKNNNRNDVVVTLIPTGGNYQQPSVVVKVGNSTEPGVVIGAHMDTLSSNIFGNKPGADDDGSGSVTVLETARTILSSAMQFKKPLYFIWYAAEEEGLVGSSHVVADFKKKNIPVAAVVHFDMTGFAYENDPAIWLMTDYVDNNLVKFLETLITTYVKEPVKYSQCGYACSDHATWTQNGYPAAIPAEAAYENTNPAMHSSQDTTDKLSLNHMTDYAKLATAFAVEVAEPI